MEQVCAKRKWINELVEFIMPREYYGREIMSNWIQIPEYKLTVVVPMVNYFWKRERGRKEMEERRERDTEIKEPFRIVLKFVRSWNLFYFSGNLLLFTSLTQFTLLSATPCFVFGDPPSPSGFCSHRTRVKCGSRNYDSISCSRDGTWSRPIQSNEIIFSQQLAHGW